MFRLATHDIPGLHDQIGGDSQAPIHIANDGTLAARADDKTQWFFATPGRVKESNKRLKRAGSHFTLEATEDRAVLPTVEGVAQGVVRVRAVDVRNRGNNMEDGTLVGKENCDEFATDVTGGSLAQYHARVGKKLLGYREPMGLALGDYLYAAGDKRKHRAGKTAVDARDRQVEEANAADKAVHPVQIFVTRSERAQVYPEKQKVGEYFVANDLEAALAKHMGKDRPFTYSTVNSTRFSIKPIDEARTAEILGRLCEGDDALIAAIEYVEGVKRPDAPTCEDIAAASRAQLATLAPVRPTLAKSYGLDEHAAPKIGEAFGILETGTEGAFQYHWAGVIARAHDDAVTLENFAGNGKQPFFALYGPLTSVAIHEGDDNDEKPKEQEQEKEKEKERRRKPAKLLPLSAVDDEEGRASTTFHGRWQSDYKGNALTAAFKVGKVGKVRKK